MDEFVAATGYHRKAAVRLLRHGVPGDTGGQRKRPGGRPREYSAVVIGALRVAAEASGWICGKRLAPFSGELVPALEAEGALRLEPADREQLPPLSAATIDRRSRLFRLQRRPQGVSTTKPGTR